MGEIRTTKGQEAPKTKSEIRKGRFNILLRITATLVVVGILGSVIKVPRYASASGYATTGTYSEVRSTSTGRIAKINAFSGDSVKAGDVLVQLENAAELVAVTQASNHVAECDATLALKKASVAEALRSHAQKIHIAEMVLAHAKEQFAVTQQLFEKGLASGRTLSNDKFAIATAEEALASLKAEDTTLGAKEIAVLEQARKTAVDELNRALVALEHRQIKAPISGRVIRYTFYEGEVMRPDFVVYEIFDGAVDLLKVRVPERYAARVRKGQKLRAYLGTYKTLIPTRFYGEVMELRDVVEGEGAATYRVAYCSIADRGLTIAPGTSADADILTGKSSLWNLILEP